MAIDSDNPLNNSPQRFFVLIPCAGSGSRAGGAQPKQYQTVAGKAMVAHTLAAFEAVEQSSLLRWGAIAVVLAPHDQQFAVHCADFERPGRMVLRCGGSSRAQTVANGLQALLQPSGGAQPNDWVLVHDAARCLITPAQIAQLVAACADDAVGGLLALPLADTLKSEQGGRVAQTLERNGKWLAQTPQMFRIGELLQALRHAGDEVTDESSAMEALGKKPLLVAGSAQNFKVTYAADFALAEAVLRSREQAALGSTSGRTSP